MARAKRGGTARPWRLAAAVGAALALAACGSADDSALPPCPTVQIVEDLAELTKFRPGEGRDLTDVTLEAQIVGFGGNCETDFDEGAAGIVETEMQIQFTASRGPANKARASNFSYFVAYAGADREVVDKGVFSTDFLFEGNRNTMSFGQERLIVIELQEGESADDYFIYVGFQLKPEEVEYNRARLRR